MLKNHHQLELKLRTPHDRIEPNCRAIAKRHVADHRCVVGKQSALRGVGEVMIECEKISPGKKAIQHCKNISERTYEHEWCALQGRRKTQIKTTRRAEPKQKIGILVESKMKQQKQRKL